MDALKMLNALAELKDNDGKIVFVSRAMRYIKDDVVVKLFPFQYGIRVINEDWGMRLIGPPTLARENNNCWSVIRQMENWERWFQLVGVKRPVQMGQRLLIETVHHTSSELSFVPNPIETHPMVDTLTSIFVSDDNMSCVDHSISLEMDS